MAAIRIHAVYLTVIAVLSYALWSEKRTSQNLCEQVQKFMVYDCLIMSSEVENMKNACEKNINTRQYYVQTYRSKMDSLSTISKATFKYLDNALIGLKNNQNVHINAINDTVNNYSKVLLNLISDDRDKKASLNIYGIHRITQADTINDIKKNSALYLQTLKNQILRDEVFFYSYVLDQTARNYCGITQKLGVAIVPNKSVIIEGEKFEADIYISNIVTSRPDSCIFRVNNQILKVTDGVGHYKETAKSTGLKRVKAQISVTNPATGEITDMNSEFEYQVLPKCSIDCNKNQ
jgi:hypothetical protein